MHARVVRKFFWNFSINYSSRGAVMFLKIPQCIFYQYFELCNLLNSIIYNAKIKIFKAHCQRPGVWQSVDL